MKQRLRHLLRILVRCTMISGLLSIILFAAAGSTSIISIRHYLAVFSSVLLLTMLAVDPQLARERERPGPDDASQSLRFAAGFLFLLTIVVAAFEEGHLRTKSALPTSTYLAALIIFAISSSFQTWAMISNPFFSPAVRIQHERGHHLIVSGPYRFVRHPGYLAMCVSAICSAIAIGSYLALIPALAFVFVIHRRARLEHAFLELNLDGFAFYAERVSAGLPFIRSS